ncbi:MAG: hypothetical protein FJ246_01145 [Nitrospira sp.]|nr:hypothetical protein [Nitrospira sp.]
MPLTTLRLLQTSLTLKLPFVRLGWALLALSLALSSAGCEKVSSALGRATIPNLGPAIPVTAKIDFDPSLSKAMLQYTNACNAPQQLRVGEELESVLLQAAHQTFKTIYAAGKVPAGVQPDVEILLALQQSGLDIQTDGIYDRLPAELTLEVVALFKDPSGKVLLEQPINIARKEKLILEPTQHRCEYITTDAMLHDAAVTLSIQFIRHARALLDPDGQLAGAAEAQDRAATQPTGPAQAPAIATTPSPTAPAMGPALSFKATVLDENSNLILEGGERVKVRVDLVNTGQAQARNVSVTLSGTPAIIAQFPATTLPAGSLQPGESRAVEFSATLPATVQAQQASFQVSLSEASGAGLPAPQTLVLAMKQRGERGGGSLAPALPTAKSAQFDDVDQVPVAAAGFQRPQTYLISVGIGSYRDPQVPTRKYAARDAELVAGYFQSLGGVPTANLRVLQDRRALRPDIEEALIDWLPTRVTAESTVILYFSGQALVTPSGETYLVPYEGGRTSASRLYPLKDIQAALAKLKARHSLLIFDGAVGQLGKEGRAKSSAPMWDGGGGNLVTVIGTTGLRSGLEPAQMRHGLFTYYLLAGLKGEADADHNGEVTLGELTTFLNQTVPVAARAHFSQEQRPLILPPLSPTNAMAALPLTRTASPNHR